MINYLKNILNADKPLNAGKKKVNLHKSVKISLLTFILFVVAYVVWTSHDQNCKNTTQFSYKHPAEMPYHLGTARVFPT